MTNFQQSTLTKLFLLVLVITLSACNINSSQQNQNSINQQTTSMSQEDKQKYEIVNNELKSLGLKLVPPGNLPKEFNNVPEMSKKDDPMGMGNSFMQAMTSSPKLEWINKPPNTPIPEDLVIKATPIVKRYFTGCTWSSGP
ncbi:MAG: hypothetical protein AB1782_06090 [Cyanobacteriota bacterium]